MPAPLIGLDWSHRGVCIVHFGPNPGNERNNGMPTGVRGGRIWWHIGGLPADESGWDFLAESRTSPWQHQLEGTGSATVAYRVQYIDRALQTGPFSDPAVATITL